MPQASRIHTLVLVGSFQAKYRELQGLNSLELLEEGYEHRIALVSQTMNTAGACWRPERVVDSQGLLCCRWAPKTAFRVIGDGHSERDMTGRT
jgi:hypothetical protein